MQRPLTSEQGYRFGSKFFDAHDGYYYYSDRRRNGVTYFRCIYSSYGRSGRVTLRAESFLEQSSPHDHEPNFQYAQLRRERQVLVNQAESLDVVHPHEILDSERCYSYLFSSILYHLVLLFLLSYFFHQECKSSVPMCFFCA